ncbi:MAG TPA: hypothetical protein VH760_12550 [Gaiellaceae bacterium]|jgi:hypothetical protein
MPYEITPAPTPEERDALLRALAVQNGSDERPSPWWQAGIGEAVELEPEPDETPGQARARPRRSAGASRA